ncbi:hypothetical protein AAZX31_03G062300 [Glycine max]|nr:hypothetical protein JHK87_006486 [Glycine soja]KAG5071428.1 hypothetical protein JHK86_006639 [Glycine max]KAH1068925.1 hypothetical protein GYH30_006487 [Glycine max]KAH1256939.1 hypothetical protein GmHk_03G007005 [Glycine max]KRH65958.2 hypothetical protein GLYMA_03G073100v4 [Glycine max]
MMPKFLFLFFLLANTLLSLTNATSQPQIIFQSLSAPSSNPPAQSPSIGQRPHTSEPSIGRKLGKHQHNQIRSSDTKSPTPSEAPQNEKNMHSISEGSIPSHQRTSIEPHDEAVLGSHHGQVHLLKHRHHHSKSIAGAGVILAGLAATFLVSVFCYIRATRRNKIETTA